VEDLSCSHTVLPASASRCAAGTAVAGRTSDDATRASDEPDFSTRSARRGLSFTLRLRKLSWVPLAMSRTVRLNRSPATSPKLLAISGDTLLSMRARNWLPQLPAEAASSGRFAILIAAFAGLPSVPLCSRTIAACAPPLT
jgi:hypothetical protein